MPASAIHRGVAEDDPRNRGAIAYFAPKPVTPESIRETLRRSRPEASTVEIEARVREVTTRIATGPIKPPAPLSQSLAEVDDPVNGLGTHPDIVAHLWKLDATLPRSCRWVFWGRPALVHPETSVIFAVGFGTLGYVMRLPPAILDVASADQARVAIGGNPGQSFEIGAAGPEWRFVRPRAPEAEWCRAAYEFAGTGPS